ncbi:hypothetical protein [Pectinatus haikarae]|uniref:hypothetical protein n=1 Tax=Pectinatus haikarae TaxID=349096 RepID=UPI0018C4962B|nr:hypothetical protein [Pectinatus haikarae]
MKKILLNIIATLFLLTSFCYAAQFPDKNNMDSVDWTYGGTTGTAITFYYAPSLTTLSPQGKLETWIKMVIKDSNGNVTETDIGHNFVNYTFENYKEIESLEYDSDGKLRADYSYTDANWKNMPDGTPFESTLQSALQYVKDNQ